VRILSGINVLQHEQDVPRHPQGDKGYGEVERENEHTVGSLHKIFDGHGIDIVTVWTLDSAKCTLGAGHWWRIRNSLGWRRDGAQRTQAIVWQADWGVQVCDQLSLLAWRPMQHCHIDAQ